jgi:hypothetical protein
MFFLIFLGSKIKSNRPALHYQSVHFLIYVSVIKGRERERVNLSGELLLFRPNARS